MKTANDILAEKLAAFGVASKNADISISIHQKDRGFGSFAKRAILVAGLVVAAMSFQTKQVDVQQEAYQTSTQSQSAEVSEEADTASKPWMTPSLEKAVKNATYVDVKFEGKTYEVLSPESRVALTKAVAEEVGLKKVGLSSADLYGVIYAESGWIPRDGMGKNGVKSRGLAQFEANTANMIGIQDANDPVQAIYGAAVLLKQGAQWSASKLRSVGFRGADVHKNRAFHEGVSIHYNTSTALRNSWDTQNTDDFPDATKAHIKNATTGKNQAKKLEKQFVNLLGGNESNLNQNVNHFNDTVPGWAAMGASLSKLTASPCDVQITTMERTGSKEDQILSTCADPQAALDLEGQSMRFLQVGSSEANGSPVFLADVKGIRFGAGITGQKDNDKYQILLEHEFVDMVKKTMSAKDAEIGLRFIMKHEEGHIHKHREDARGDHNVGGHRTAFVSGDFNNESMDELESDNRAIASLLQEGYSKQEIISAASKVLTAVFAHVQTAPQADLLPRIQNIHAYTEHMHSEAQKWKDMSFAAGNPNVDIDQSKTYDDSPNGWAAAAKELSRMTDSPCSIEAKRASFFGEAKVLSTCAHSESTLEISDREVKYLQVGESYNKNVPIFLTEIPNMKFGAAVYGDKKADTYKVLVERSFYDLVNKNMSPRLAEIAMRFIINHEEGHVLQHRRDAMEAGWIKNVMPGNNDPKAIQEEMDADRMAIQDLVDSGVGADDVYDAVTNVLNITYRHVYGSDLTSPGGDAGLSQRLENVGQLTRYLREMAPSQVAR